MNQPIDARCVECGERFPRRLGENAGDDGLTCPTCGHGVVQGIPHKQTSLGTRRNARCAHCGATFPHVNSRTAIKGVLACPTCEATGDVMRLDATRDSTTRKITTSG